METPEQAAVDAFIAAALPLAQDHRDGGLEPALALLDANPGIPGASIHAAAMVGAVEEVRSMLEANPALAIQRGGPKNWDPLLYLSFSRFLRLDPERAESMVAVAELLLQHGADPNTYWVDKNEAPGNRETPLYGAAGVANLPALARLLIEAGADPNDGETPYHMVEHDRVPCADIIFPKLNDLSRGAALGHKLDYDDLPGLRRLLELGGDPNGPSPFNNKPLHQAVWRCRNREFFDLLFEFGADVNLPTQDGKTAYALAARVGKTEIMGWLVERGADITLGPIDGFLAACAAGDAVEAQRRLVAEPDLLQSLPDADQAVICDAAATGNTTGVAAMLDVGWDVDTRGSTWKEGPIHRAAIEGHLATVRLLVERGADLTLRDASYKSSPLGWAAHGGRGEVLRYLLGHPERLDLRDAFEFGLTERALELLGDTHPDTGVAGGERGCLLRAAAYSGHAELVHHLLKRGADPSLRNSLGLRAADYARERNHESTVRILERDTGAE